MRELGLTPGRDVSIVTHDDDLSFLPNGGGDAAVHRDALVDPGRGPAVGGDADRRIDDPDAAPRSELWEVDLVIGDSTGPNPRGARGLDREQ